MLALAFALLASPPVPEPAAAPAPAADQLDFPIVARRYLERHGADASAREIDLFPFLAEHHARIDLGAFRVNVPATALEDDDEFELVQTVCLELLDAQLRWLEWIHQGPHEQKLKEMRFDRHVKEVKRWVDSWRYRTWRREYGGGRRDFTPVADDDEDLYRSSTFLIDYLGRGEPLQTGRAEPVLTPIYLFPKREDFVELACLLGLVFSHLRHEYWQQDTWAWTQFYYEDAHFFALRFAGAADQGGGAEVQGYTGDYTESTPMDRFNPEGLEQQLVQLSMRGLMQNLFGDRISPTFSAGLSSLLVVDIYGEVDTRTDGDLRPKKTQARSMFVAGGASGGGTLPPDYADGRFRSPNHGSDFFVPILQRVQQQGGKDARSKDDAVRSFEILDDEEKDTFLLQAPVLHFSTERRVRAPAPGFIGDLLEFVRAYRICFVHWLRDQAGGGRSESREKFAQFLSALSSPDGSLELALEQIYEKPLSDETASRKTLEGEFLRWLEDR